LKGKKLMETAVVREYARWCGGTAARAASYPIRKMPPQQNQIIVDDQIIESGKG